MTEIEQARERLRKWRTWQNKHFRPRVSYGDGSTKAYFAGSHITTGTANQMIGYSSSAVIDPYREYDGGLISENDAEIRRQIDLVTVALG